MDDEPTPVNGEEEVDTSPVLTLYVDQFGNYHLETRLVSPMDLAAAAWYIDQMARRLLASIMAAQNSQPQGPGLYVPQGFTQDHKKGRN